MEPHEPESMGAEDEVDEEGMDEEKEPCYKMINHLIFLYEEI